MAGGGVRVELTCPVALDAGSTSTAACSEAVLATFPRPFLFLLSPQICPVLTFRSAHSGAAGPL
jgi:hypothetical protein